MGSAFQWRRFVYAQAAFVLVLVVGTAGFQAILGEGWVSSFYRTVVTTTLTGLDSQPPGAGAKLFTILLLLGGVAIFLYLAGAIVDLIAHGAISEAYAERKLRRTIDDLHDHAIICGFGRVGRRVAAEFEAIGSSYVVLDHNEEALDAAREHGGLVVHGDGTSDDDLRRAGIVRASALVASADSDESNLFITLSARALRPDLTIVARASVDATARKLRLAGADQVVQPYTSAGLQMANVVLKPQVAAFLDIATTAGGAFPELRFEEILVTKECTPCGRSIADLRIRQATGALVVAIRKHDGTYDVTPTSDAVFEQGDVVIGVGTTEEMSKLEQLFAPSGAAA
ncbi:MAG: TrkA family potassium uptake protein [Actinobacteria bacterium]|nr:MAG: TrkA family potassium uptake protein [Actinomycetota bacterium]TML48798.1 MAG: TrkA family potassium uptake protein [Actinomycetota bacterium]TML71612.1 MAG: TrkA family potassium uptake protein [Actinomycetota bacterium]